jgi:hypothetical protein
MIKKLVVAGAAFACATGSAVAAPPELPHVNGLLVLPNTRVINGVPSSKSAPSNANNARIFAGSSAQGVAAEPTRSEINALAHAHVSPLQSSDNAKSVTGGFPRTSADGSITGIRIADLSDDGDLMPYSVVRREANGTVRHMCVQGNAQAMKFVLNKAAGARNDR